MAVRARVDAVLAVLGIEFDSRPVHGRLVALCPYHRERNASWSISIEPDKYGIHYCRACKNGGTLVDLVSHVRGITIFGARFWLDEFETKVKVEEPVLPVAVTVERVGPPPAFTAPVDVMFAPLAEWPSPPREFLEKRGVTAAQVKCFRIGYAVSGRLAGRVVFPTWKGKVMHSYMARDFTGHRKAKRYLYPPSEDHPDLDVMFAEHTWPSSHGGETVIVHEGALNALAVHRVTFFYVTAIGGSDVRLAHVAKLATFSRVIVFTDSDEPGDRVAQELVTALCRHTDVRRVRLTPVVDERGKTKDANDLPPDELRDFLCRAVLTPS